MGFNSDTYLGIKMTAFNPATLMDQGVFFTVNQSYWELSEEQKASLPKRRGTKPEPLNDHYHIPELLKRQGFAYLFKKAQARKQDKSLKWLGLYGRTSVDVFESYFTRNSARVD